eukprot:3187252-Prymnesium_polylepis.2
MCAQPLPLSPHRSTSAETRALWPRVHVHTYTARSNSVICAYSKRPQHTLWSPGGTESDDRLRMSTVQSARAHDPLPISEVWVGLQVVAAVDTRVAHAVHGAQVETFAIPQRYAPQVAVGLYPEEVLRARTAMNPLAPCDHVGRSVGRPGGIQSDGIARSIGGHTQSRHVASANASLWQRRQPLSDGLMLAPGARVASAGAAKHDGIVWRHGVIVYALDRHDRLSSSRACIQRARAAIQHALRIAVGRGGGIGGHCGDLRTLGAGHGSVARLRRAIAHHRRAASKRNWIKLRGAAQPGLLADYAHGVAVADGLPRPFGRQCNQLHDVRRARGQPWVGRTDKAVRACAQHPATAGEQQLERPIGKHGAAGAVRFVVHQGLLQRAQQSCLRPARRAEGWVVAAWRRGGAAIPRVNRGNERGGRALERCGHLEEAAAGDGAVVAVAQRPLKPRCAQVERHPDGVLDPPTLLGEGRRARGSEHMRASEAARCGRRRCGLLRTS